ncbi:MAG: DUF424 family protein [Staphylothermus sp.]|nr:DUF424 family protein [Staphylothermus sp.]
MDNDQVRVYVKIHKYGEERIIAICDEDLLGKNIIDEEKGIKFYVDPYFYKGELLSISKALMLLKRASIANLVGKNIVNAAKNNGLIHENAVLYIKDIPHAQFAILY